jgi:hypothetical protein
LVIQIAYIQFYISALELQLIIKSNFSFKLLHDFLLALVCFKFARVERDIYEQMDAYYAMKNKTSLAIGLMRSEQSRSAGLF